VAEKFSFTLMTPPSEEEEQEALEDALYALRAFRSAWQHPEAA
jgi:hypothetical protein